jgi:predicted Fe-S protein YdhL (DUF1289 family)
VLATTILLLVYVSVSRNRPKKLGTVPSPCIKVCRIDDDGFCVGCKRTVDEIRDWMVMSDYEQQKLVYELKWRQDEIRKV